MTSLAAVHTAAALVIRALGDAGVSDRASLELDVHGIVVRPLLGRESGWAAVVTALSADALQSPESRPYGVFGHIDDVPVTAIDWHEAVPA